MNKLLILFIILSSSSLWAQSEDPLDIEYKKLKLYISQNTEWIANQESNKKLALSNIAKFEGELKHLETLLQNRKEYQQQILEEVNKELKEVPGVLRIVSKKASYFRCLKENLSTDQSEVFQSCSKKYQAKLSLEESQQVEKWFSLIGLTPDELKSKAGKLKLDINSQKAALDAVNKRIESALSQEERFYNDEQKILMKYENRKIAKENAKYVNCDENTPDISLEDEVPYPGAKFKGPFAGVPRDNQDGVGTCYANTAKNLLVGTSRGKDVASFLDLALLYKQNDGVISSGLDGGFTCHTLEKLKLHGYCPQGLAPIETGEANLYTEDWLGNKDSWLWGQSVTIEYLQKFLAGKEKFKKDSPLMSQTILAKSQDLIKKIKADPDIKLPLPVVRYQIPDHWKLRETYELEKHHLSGVSLTAFQSEYNEQYKIFYPFYVRAVFEGKNADEVFAIFEEKMKPFIDKYKLSHRMGEWKRLYQSDSMDDYRDPNLMKSFAASLELLKFVKGKTQESNEEFLKDCGDDEASFMDYLANLKPLIDRLNKEKIDPDILFNEKGEFKTPTELMQLAVAPACLNQEKRQKLDHNIICDDGYQNIREIKQAKIPEVEKQMKVREKVVANLILGYPMGNTFERHINTIVGLRFNKETKKCEYKIRESQTGMSTWQAEEGIFSKIDALTEVRRK